MVTDAQIQEFHEQGFLNIGKVYADEECDRLCEAMYRVMREETEKKPVNLGGWGTDTARVVQIVNIWEASDDFLQHAKNPRICEAVSQLCETPLLRIWHDQVQYKAPKTGGPTGWHQDHPLWPTIQPPDLVSAWVALEDATVENGCMWMIPGSHQWGNQQRFLGTREEDGLFVPIHRDPSQLPEGVDLTPVPFAVKKGECGIHHCLTWHGSPHNRSDKPRPAIAVHYMPAHIRHEPVGRHIMDKFVDVPVGEVLAGPSFPVVYERNA